MLIVGGGDGGVARELARYTSLEKIEQAEIDEAVPEVRSSECCYCIFFGMIKMR